jgi:hypothetical protein
MKTIDKRTMMKIQEDIDTAFELAIETCVDEDGEWTGEIPADLESVFDELEIEKEAKLDGVIRGEKQLRSDIAFLKAEKKALDARIKAKTAKADGYKQYLSYVLEGNKFESAGGTVSYRKSTSVAFSEDVEEAIREGFVPLGYEDIATTETVVKISKTDVGKLLKSGADIEGAELVTKVNTIIK